MTKRPNPALGVLLVAISTLGSSDAVPSTGPASHAIDVELVNVAVWVQDRLGNPVETLEADDFQLYVDRQPRPLTHFSRIDLRDGSDPSDSLPDPSRPQPHLTIYIDTTFLRAGELFAITPTLARFLNQTLPPTTPVMLAVAEPGFRILEGFTTERQGLASSIGVLSKGVGTNRFDNEYSQIQRQFEEVLTRAASGALPVVPGAQAESVLTQVGGLAAALQGELENAAARLSFLIQMLQGLPGSQEVLFLTGRPPAHAGADLLTAWLTQMGQNRVFSQASDSGLGGGEATEDSVASDLESSAAFGSRATAMADLNGADILRRVGTRAAAAGVTLHTADLSSIQPRESVGGTSGTGHGSTAVALGSAGRASIHQGVKDLRLLEDIVSVTGGELLTGPDLIGDLERLQTRRHSFYSLAFTPSEQPDSEPREITLRLVDQEAGHALSYRRYYRMGDHDLKAAQATTSSLLANQADNPLGAALSVESRNNPADTSSIMAEVTLVLPFSRIALRPEGSHHIGQLSVFFLWGETYRQTSDVRKGIVPIRIANNEMLTALGRSIEYTWEMEVPGQAPLIGVGVRDDLSDLFSTIHSSIRNRP